jgi:hypothetical protein
MLRVLHHLRHHRLHHRNIPIQQPTHNPRGQRDPVVLRHTKDQTRQRHARQAGKHNRLPAIPVGNRAPEDSGAGLGQREARYQQARVEGGVLFRVPDILDEEVVVCGNRRECDRLSEST